MVRIGEGGTDKVPWELHKEAQNAVFQADLMSVLYGASKSGSRTPLSAQCGGSYLQLA